MSLDMVLEVWRHSPRKDADLLVLLAIADASNEQGEGYPSLGTIAHRCRRSVRQAQRIIKKLELAGELAVWPCPGESMTHRFHDNTNHFFIEPIPGAPPRPKPWQTKRGSRHARSKRNLHG